MAANSSTALRCAFVLFTLSALNACGGGGSTESTSAPTLASATVRVVDTSDVEIAQALYADDHRTPAGFLADPAPLMDGYVATSHLKNTDLPGISAATQYELCADDWVVALGWSDQSANALSASTLIETNGTPHYHEFLRVRTGSPQGYLRTRVYRCAYLDRSSIDLRTSSASAGQFNLRPLTAPALQELVEYLWRFTSYNNYGNVVLKSSASATDTELKHTLVIASFDTSAPSNCDHVSVIGWSYAVNRQTGALTRSSEPLWDFGVRRNAGWVELCNPF